MPKYNYSQYSSIPVSIEVTVGEVKDLVRILQEAGNNATSKYSSERVAHREWTAILQNAIREVKSSVEWDGNIHDRPIEYKETA